ncbi:MAG: alpha-xylosidase [Anaerolineae bacterium]|nr:alpha-xylosidase [Anaerolineae bacterium]
MKFDQGHWQLLPHTTAIYPVSVVDVQAEKDALTITAYDCAVQKRWDYLDGAILTVRFSAPMKHVVRVQVVHFKGQQPRLPVFDLDYSLSDPDVVTGCDDQRAWLTTGDLSVSVNRQGPWTVSFTRGGQPLTASESQALALFTQNDQPYLREQLSLQVGETIYGLGEHFGPLVKNGQAIDMWNEDGGTDSEYAYKNVPFYLSSAGYGVLVNHPGRVSFEVGSHHVSRVQFSVGGHSLDYYLFGGPSLKDVLDQYTRLSGRPAQIPDWSFGLWLSTSFTTNYDEQAILANLERMEQLSIPIAVFHFDCFWMRELTWCSFLWDRRCFPDPAGMLARIKQKGVNISVWINPYIAEASPLFAEGAALGYLLTNPQGDVYQVDKWQPGLAFVDFTNPDARAWYAGKLQALLDMGVDVFKTDFGERIPADARYFDGSNPERMHNYYTYLYNQTVFDLLRRAKGEASAVVFARSATTGNQQFPVHWGGDNSSTYPSMAETLRGGLSLGLSGFGYWSHDISGFNGTATPDLYKRWVAFGLLSSHSRLHGADSLRMPWIFDDEASDVLRYFVRLKQHLTPYLLDAAAEAHRRGLPMMRPMVLEFPDDLTCRYLDTQYMLGPALLVAPIFNDRGIGTCYLPGGTWRHLLTGESVEGGAWRTAPYDYFSLPLWVHSARGERWDCLRGYTASR